MDANQFIDALEAAGLDTRRHGSGVVAFEVKYSVLADVCAVIANVGDDRRDDVLDILRYGRLDIGGCVYVYFPIVPWPAWRLW